MQRSVHVLPRIFAATVFVVFGADLTGCRATLARRPNTAEKVILATYMVASDRVMGSGFLVAVRDAAGTSVPVLVTSMHLIEKSNGRKLSASLRFVSPTGDAVVFPVPLSLDQPGYSYALHPSLDVAAFRVEWPPDFPSDFVLPLVESSEIDASHDVRAGEIVTFAGFPEGGGGPSGAFAVLRSGRIASFEQSFFDARIYLINAAAYPGDSGAPVFVTHGRGRSRLVGMVVEYVADSREHPMPLCLAVDARAIRETINQLVNPPPTASKRLRTTTPMPRE